MTPHELGVTLDETWSRLRTSPVGARLENGCRAALLGRHLNHPTRSPEIITTIAIELGEKGGWFSLWQAGGGLKVIIWVPPDLYRMSEVRTDVDELQRKLSGVLHLGEVQRRVIADPDKWLRSKGWPLEDNACSKH